MSAIAICAVQAIDTPASRFRIMPAGLFRARDGRPKDLPGWMMDREAAQRIIAATSACKGDLVVDYEHQTLKAQSNPGGAPAAGWCKSLEWVEGDGLYVTDARWTAKATAMITAKEYRYISPVFAFDASGRVTGLHSIALTNNPALDGLTDLAAATRQNIAAMKHVGITEEDHTKLQHVFGTDYAQCMAQHNSASSAADTPPDGISESDHMKLKRIFGPKYMLPT